MHRTWCTIHLPSQPLTFGFLTRPPHYGFSSVHVDARVLAGKDTVLLPASMCLSWSDPKQRNHFCLQLYEGRWQSLWTHFINPIRNFLEVRWRSLFRSTSLGKRCTSYNAPPTSRKRAADRWSLRKFSLRRSLFMVRKSINRMGRDLDCMADVLMGFHRYTFSKPNTEFNSYFAPSDFWTSPTMKTELRDEKFRSDQRSAERFREVGGVL
jgi:hypothetical protein